MASSALVPLVKVEKKIAQISRVIQHLNAKSDDNELDSLAGNYENEIEGILRDASDRVRRFHAACEHKQDNTRLEARAKEIESKYEAQRVKALKEISEFKKRTGTQQEALKQESEAKVGAMAKQLEAVKREFATKMRQFAEVAETLQKQGEGSKELKAAHAKELDEARARHLREIEEVAHTTHGPWPSPPSPRPGPHSKPDARGDCWARDATPTPTPTPLPIPLPLPLRRSCTSTTRGSTR